jgi:hypothetical protein
MPKYAALIYRVEADQPDQHSPDLGGYTRPGAPSTRTSPGPAS